MYIYTIHYLHSIEISIGSKRSRGSREGKIYIQEFIRNFSFLFEIENISTLLNRPNGLLAQLGNVNFSYKLNSDNLNEKIYTDKIITPIVLIPFKNVLLTCWRFLLIVVHNQSEA